LRHRRKQRSHHPHPRNEKHWHHWDPGNALASGEVPFPNGYEQIKPYLVNLHVKDGVATPKIEWRLVNDGGVNWLGQLTAIIREHNLPFVTLETHVDPFLESSRENLTDCV
jgi:hypothetical protein